MPFVWVGGGCARLGVCIDAGVVIMAAQKGPYDGVLWVLCVVSVACLFSCLYREV